MTTDNAILLAGLGDVDVLNVQQSNPYNLATSTNSSDAKTQGAINDDGQLAASLAQVRPCPSGTLFAGSFENDQD